jgi:hypothetical protein
MTEKREPPLLSDFLPKQTFVTLQRQGGNEADAAATKSLIETFTDKDGFHCPRCKATITNPEEAVEHLAMEINKAMQEMSNLRFPPTEEKV